MLMKILKILIQFNVIFVKCIIYFPAELNHFEKVDAHCFGQETVDICINELSLGKRIICGQQRWSLPIIH